MKIDPLKCLACQLPSVPKVHGPGVCVKAMSPEKAK